MAICQYCGKEWHVCTNCCLTYEWEERFCSEQCREASKEFKDMKDIYINLLGSLTSKQREWLEIVINHDDEYWSLYEEWESEFFNTIGK
ncbi:hypothetical protein LCGC14_2717140 [marine sediment metagenome]|uniref:Uncharacterized protein n=1 Tax=marine sediment metagenome TaxID=412755 RepID=A0A0F8ZYU8_9ZZZZ